MRVIFWDTSKNGLPEEFREKQDLLSDAAVLGSISGIVRWGCSFLPTPFPSTFSYCELTVCQAPWGTIIHSFTRHAYLSSTYYVPGTILAEKDAVVNKTDNVLPWGAHSRVDMQRN